jgi:hypothetical protein
VRTDPEHSVPNLTSGREEATSREGKERKGKTERIKVQRSERRKVERSNVEGQKWTKRLIIETAKKTASVDRLVEKHPCGCDDAENKIEWEEFGVLAKQFARNTTVLLLSFDLALDLDSSVNLFRHTLSLLSSMVDAKKSEYNIQA